MSIKAYIFVEVEQGSTRKIAKKLCTLSEVEEAHSVSGPYDIIALIEVENLTSLANLLTNKVYTINGVKRTLSNIIVD